jgi:hypothetical protein
MEWHLYRSMGCTLMARGLTVCRGSLIGLGVQCAVLDTIECHGCGWVPVHGMVGDFGR